MFDPMRSRAVVTGGGSGLGRALCLEIAGRGGRVLLCDVNRAGAEETVALVRERGGEAHATLADVSRYDDVERLASEADALLGGVDLLVNNAGVGVAGAVGDVPLDDWRWIFGVNLWGVIHGCHVFAPRLKRQGFGHIVNVASAAGLLSTPEMAPYNVTKAAVVSLSQTLHVELRPFGVGVTVVCPTFFRTNIAHAGRSHVEDTDARRDSVVRLMERSRVQAPDVARKTLDAVERNELYLVPMADGRWMWRVFRAAPERFYQTIAPRMLALIEGKRRTT